MQDATFSRNNIYSSGISGYRALKLGLRDSPCVLLRSTDHPACSRSARNRLSVSRFIDPPITRKVRLRHQIRTKSERDIPPQNSRTFRSLHDLAFYFI